jgi:hypothetical protein
MWLIAVPVGMVLVYSGLWSSKKVLKVAVLVASARC